MMYFIDFICHLNDNLSNIVITKTTTFLIKQNP
jgi:hypothetical protein